MICVGDCQTAEPPYFIFNDPACVGHTILYTDELNRRWIDLDGDGAIFEHFGIEITQSTTNYKIGLFFMDLQFKRYHPKRFPCFPAGGSFFAAPRIL